MIVRAAALSDVDTVLRWRSQRAAWIAARGSDQWQTPWPRSLAEQAVRSGQMWMIWDGTDPVASFVLSDAAQVTELWKLDTDYGHLWLDSDRPASALYVSKMVVPLEHAGEGLGAEILDWCGGTAFEAEKIWLRLDAWTTNTGLHDWYMRQGFKLVRVVPTRVSGACFQRPALPYRGWRLKSDA